MKGDNMDSEKKRKLEEAGWKVGTVDGFLSDTELKGVLESLPTNKPTQLEFWPRDDGPLGEEYWPEETPEEKVEREEWEQATLADWDAEWEDKDVESSD